MIEIERAYARQVVHTAFYVSFYHRIIHRMIHTMYYGTLYAHTLYFYHCRVMMLQRREDTKKHGKRRHIFGAPHHILGPRDPTSSSFVAKNEAHTWQKNQTMYNSITRIEETLIKWINEDIRAILTESTCTTFHKVQTVPVSVDHEPGSPAGRSDQRDKRGNLQ